MNNGGMQNAGGMQMMGGGVSMPMNAGNVSAMPLSSGGGPQQVMMPAMMPTMGAAGAGGGGGGIAPSSGGGSDESTYVFSCRRMLHLRFEIDCPSICLLDLLLNQFQSTCTRSLFLIVVSLISNRRPPFALSRIRPYASTHSQAAALVSIKVAPRQSQQPLRPRVIVLVFVLVVLLA